MQHHIIIVLLFLQTCFTAAQNKANTVFTPAVHWNDNNGVHINAHGGGILFDNATYYWYGEHKIEGPIGNSAQVGVHCYLSQDLYNWKDLGIVLPVEAEGSGSDIEKGCIMERPKVIYNEKNRQYIMWFHLEPKGQGYNAARTALAVSDNAAGPFKYLRSLRPNAGIWPVDATENEKINQPETSDHLKDVRQGLFMRRDLKGGQMARDMTLFQDQKKAYLIYAAEDNFTLNIAELDDNYTGFTGKWLRLFPGGHNEAPALFKKDGIYYLITSGCTGWNPNAARSAAASNIWGPWKELGNPAAGPDADLTFHSQSTFVLPVQGREDQLIFMADRWEPKNPIEGRYIWLPITFKNKKPIIKWQDSWQLNPK